MPRQHQNGTCYPDISADLRLPSIWNDSAIRRFHFLSNPDDFIWWLKSKCPWSMKCFYLQLWIIRPRYRKVPMGSGGFPRGLRELWGPPQNIFIFRSPIYKKTKFRCFVGNKSILFPPFWINPLNQRFHRIRVRQAKWHCYPAQVDHKTKFLLFFLFLFYFFY